eukprot:GGOE01036699.1.p1 GENE.GGOE01036699.1~~GGOE01036699.1.p1  ORF type:complete len:374 (+),score=108.41 GGOE01036699.1:68-1189(+)
MTSHDGPPPNHGILQSMFLHAPPELLEEVLIDCDGALEKAVDRLLAMSSDTAVSSSPQGLLLPSLDVATVQPTPCACLHTYCTAALDESLLYCEGAGPGLLGDSILREYTCVPSGSQVTPMAGSSSSSSNVSPSYGENNGHGHGCRSPGGPCAGASGGVPAVPAMEMTLTSLLLSSAANFDATQDQVKKTLIPLICQELSQLKMPPVTDEVPTGSSGTLSFGTGELGMAALSFRPEDTRIELHEDSLRVWISHISGRAKKFTWWYSKTGFPRLKDKGKASIKFSEASVHLSFNICFAAPKPTIVVQAAEVSIGRLTLRLSGTWLSFLYNLLLRALNRHLKNSVEQGLRQLVMNLSAPPVNAPVVAPIEYAAPT